MFDFHVTFQETPCLSSTFLLSVGKWTIIHTPPAAPTNITMFGNVPSVSLSVTVDWQTKILHQSTGKDLDELHQLMQKIPAKHGFQLVSFKTIPNWLLEGQQKNSPSKSIICWFWSATRGSRLLGTAHPPWLFAMAIPSPPTRPQKFAKKTRWTKESPGPKPWNPTKKTCHREFGALF